VDVFYDNREEKSSVPDFLRELDLEIEAAHLSEGDYIIGERACVERKSAADFVSSLKSGRLWDQIGRMSERYEVVVVIVEGQPRFPAASLEGAYAGVVRRGASLFRVANSEETASFIRRIALQEKKPKRSRKPRATRKWRGPDEISEDVLSAIPGISVSRAEDLLEHFGSLGAIASADAKDLQEVAGIGKKTAEEIAGVFQHQRKSTPWD
jgi:ERCC4-type nuclease